MQAQDAKDGMWVALRGKDNLITYQGRVFAGHRYRVAGNDPTTDTVLIHCGDIVVGVPASELKPSRSWVAAFRPW